MDNLYLKLLNERQNESIENRQFIITCLFMLLCFLFFFLFISSRFFYVQISGDSMNNTLKDGEVLVVNRYARAGYGDIIIIKGEKYNQELIIKRVIGLQGDTIVIENGEVYRNGEKLEETYALGSTYFEGENPARKEYVVPKGNVFYLGDNRMNSRDSRSDFFTCDYSQIEGVVCSWSLHIRPVTAFLTHIWQANDNKVGD